jgi:glycine betaine/proline transport system permease protein
VSEAAVAIAGPRLRLGLWPMTWAIAILAVLLFYLHPDSIPWAAVYPDSATIPVAKWIGAIMDWILRNFRWLTREIADLLNIPLKAAIALLAKPMKLGTGAGAWFLPRLSWVGVIIAAFLAGHALGGRRLALLSGASSTSRSLVNGTVPC